MYKTSMMQSFLNARMHAHVPQPGDAHPAGKCTLEVPKDTHQPHNVNPSIGDPEITKDTHRPTISRVVITSKTTKGTCSQ